MRSSFRPTLLMIGCDYPITKLLKFLLWLCCALTTIGILNTAVAIEFRCDELIENDQWRIFYDPKHTIGGNLAQMYEEKCVADQTGNSKSEGLELFNRATLYWLTGNRKAAAEFLAKGSSLDDKYSRLTLLMMKYKSKLSSSERKDVEAQLGQLAATEFFPAKLELAKIFVNRLENLTESKGVFENGVEKGYPDAAYYLGSMYYKGSGVDKDFNKAIEYYKILLNRNSPRYFTFLSSLDLTNPQIKDRSIALKYMEKAALLGSVQSRLQMGLKLLTQIDGLPNRNAVFRVFCDERVVDWTMNNFEQMFRWKIGCDPKHLSRIR